MGLKKLYRRGTHLSPAEMLQVLSQWQLRAGLLRGAVWLAMSRRSVALLNQCCVGALEGGPGTAAEVAALVGASEVPEEWFEGGALEWLRVQPSAWQQPPQQQPPQQQQPQQQQPHQQQLEQQPPHHQHQPNQQQQLKQEEQVRGVGKAGTGEAMDLLHTQGQPPQQQCAAQGQGEAEAGALVAVRLSPEEAMFLTYVLGSLQVLAPLSSSAPPTADSAPDPMDNSTGGSAVDRPAAAAGTLDGAGGSVAVDGAGAAGSSCPLAPLSAQQLWSWAMSASRGGFAASYAAYHHLRSKGWVPRSGLLYGVDYVLYSLHPAVAHSEFFVRVLPEYRRAAAQGTGDAPPQQAQQYDGLQATGNESSSSKAEQFGAEVEAATGGGGQLALSWADVQSLQRLSQTVFKRLLLLYVVLPGEAEALGSPEALDQMEVQELLLKRWVPTSSQEQRPV